MIWRGERKRDKEREAAGELVSVAEVRRLLADTVHQVQRRSAEVGLEARRVEPGIPAQTLSCMTGEEMKARLELLRSASRKPDSETESAEGMGMEKLPVASGQLLANRRKGWGHIRSS